MEEKYIKKEPLVKIIDVSSLNRGDVLLVECRKGMENEFLKKVNEELKPLILEKDLRVLAVSPEFDSLLLYKAVEFIKSYNEKEPQNNNQETTLQESNDS